MWAGAPAGMTGGGWQSPCCLRREWAIWWKKRQEGEWSSAGVKASEKVGFKEVMESLGLQGWHGGT